MKSFFDPPDRTTMIREGTLPIKRIEWLDPTPDMLHNPTFDAIWKVIKSWDINVPGAYNGYSGATGNHVRAILDAIDA